MQLRIGQRIREARAARWWTQLDLSTKAGTRSESVSRWENDKTLPQAEELASIISALGVHADWLIFGHGPMFVAGQGDGQQAVPDEVEKVIARESPPLEVARILRTMFWGDAEPTEALVSVHLMHELSRYYRRSMTQGSGSDVPSRAK